jgi:PKD repeat protein
MCTYSADGEELSINAMEKTNEEWSMPLMINALEAGVYTLTCKGINTFSAGACVTITDMRTGQSYILSEENPISLRLEAETAEEPRYVIHSGKPILASINDVSCYGAKDGSATIADPQTSLSLVWKNASGNTIHTSTNLTMSETLGNLAAGTYTIETLNNGVCGTSSFSFEITEPAEITPNATIESTTCHDSEDGSIELDIQGGFGNYMVDWNTGNTGSALYEIKTGKYTATITDLMGCSRTQEFEVTSEFAAVPNFQLGKENYILNEETVSLDIHNFSMEADEYEWVLEGFGVISNEEQPEILMAAPGTYTLTLVASNTKCSNSMTKQFTIAQPSGTDLLQSMIKGVVTEEGIRLQFFLEESNVFDIKLINVLGQQISETVHGQYGNQTITLPTGEENGPVIVFIHDVTTGENCAIKLSL